MLHESYKAVEQDLLEALALLPETNDKSVASRGAANALLSRHFQTKYQKPGGVDNIHILRVAEMYLNRAEARAHTGDLGGAIDDLNVIRIRAGIGEIEPEPSTKEGILQAIWDERKLEFAFEGHRYFDLIRTDQILTELVNLSRMNGPEVSLPSKERAIFPIPEAELDANENLIQNEA